LGSPAPAGRSVASCPPWRAPRPNLSSAQSAVPPKVHTGGSKNAAMTANPGQMLACADSRPEIGPESARFSGSGALAVREHGHLANQGPFSGEERGQARASRLTRRSAVENVAA
jgi:hypothetical protein